MGLPLADIVLAGEGRAWSGRRYCESAAGPRMRYVGHEDQFPSPAGEGPAGISSALTSRIR